MASDKIKTLTDSDFDAQVQSGVVLVDFWGEACPPCKRLEPVVQQLAEEYEGRATIAKVNTAENFQVPSRFMIRGIPTLLLFKDGDLKESHVGFASRTDLAQLIDRHLAAPAASQAAR